MRAEYVSRYSQNENIRPFSDFKDKNGWNYKMFTENAVRGVFVKYVDENEEKMMNLFKNAKIHPVLSLDHTFFVQKKTLKHIKSRKEYHPTEKNAFLIMMAGDGTVVGFHDVVGTGNNSVIGHLEALKTKCKANAEPYPQYVTVDNCCEARKMILEVFPNATVYIDVKHLINRIVDNAYVDKNHFQYHRFTTKIHGAMTGEKMTVQCTETGNVEEISSRLLDGMTVWREYGIIYESLREIVDVKGNRLFRDGFKENVLDKQKKHFENCWGEPIINGKHYHKRVDGTFTLYRGTNRNESLHRRIRKIWPDSCSEETGQRLKLCFMYNWNMKRMTGTALNHTHAGIISELHALNDHSFVSSISGNNDDTIPPQPQQGLSKREEQDVVVKEERPKKNPKLHHILIFDKLILDHTDL